MDPATITLVATSVVRLIVSAVQKSGGDFAGKVEEGAAKSIGEQIGGKVGEVFRAVAGKAQAKEAADEALQDVVTNPSDGDAQASLRTQLKKLMEADPLFAEDLHRLVSEVRPEEQAGISILVSGSGAAAAGDSVAAGQGGAAIRGNVEGGVRVGQSQPDPLAEGKGVSS